MMIEKIADGAYFVQSYSVATLAGFQGGVTNQGISVSDHLEMPEETSQRAPGQEDQTFDEMNAEEVWQPTKGRVFR